MHRATAIYANPLEPIGVVGDPRHRTHSPGAATVIGMSRIEQLARRVGWLDRYRRAIAIASAIAVSALLLWQLPSLLGDDWPRVHAHLLGIVVGIVAWCAIEVALAWLAAVWETEHDRAVRDTGLPPARLLRK
jgi:hypothetical protein